MIIANSDISMASVRQYVKKDELRESLTSWQNGEVPRTGEGPAARRDIAARAVALESQAAKVSISTRARRGQPVKAAAPVDEPGAIVEDPQLSILKLLIEKLTGKKIKIYRPADFKALAETEAAPGNSPGQESPVMVERQGWGLVYDYYESHYESEQTSFAAQGVIQTVDGRQIDFNVDLTMSREFLSSTAVNIRAGDARLDPLVINYSGNAADLTETGFSFDLDLDGRQDQIAFVRPGSGFLALDKNGDNLINDGSELFGPTTGDGFMELAGHDQDGNQWIDANDEIFDRLRIWTRDAAGNDSLFALGMKGVGAIYLGNIGTSFELTDKENNLQGAVRSTGIFVREDASVGTVQQVDLAV